MSGCGPPEPGVEEIATLKLPARARLAGEIMKLIGSEYEGALMRQRGDWVVFFIQESEANL